LFLLGVSLVDVESRPERGVMMEARFGPPGGCRRGLGRAVPYGRRGRPRGEKAARLVTDGGPLYRDMLEAANISASYYSRERFAKRVVGFWRDYLNGKGFPD